MKFNYDLYRPKKIIQDAWKSNSTYFRSKDVNVTPLTKIGDADEVYKSQSAGRIPALAKKLKPSRLALSAALARRKKILVRSLDRQKVIDVFVNVPSSKFTKQLDTKLAKAQPAWRFNANGGSFLKKSTAGNLLSRAKPVLSQLLLIAMVIGAGAGSVHAYINRSHTAHKELPSQAANQAKIEEENPRVQKDSGETPPTTPQPPATPAPTPQPTSAPITNITSNNQPSPASKPQGVADNPTKDPAIPAPIPGDTGNTTSPVPTPPQTPSAPVNVPDPAPTPVDPDPPATTPPSDGTDTPQTPDEDQQTTNPDTGNDEPTVPQAPSDPSTPTKGHASTIQKPAKQ